MFFNRLSVNAVSAKSIQSTPTFPTLNPTLTQKRTALLGLAAAMAVPAIGWAHAARAAETPASPAVEGKTIILAADQSLSDADLLKQGMDQYKNGQYEEAVTSLQRVKKDALSAGEQKQVDETLANANSAAKERIAARGEFEKGQEALNGNKAGEALGHFKAAKENKFADAGTRDKADEQMAAAQASMAQAGTDSKALYQKGRGEFRSGDWAAARKDLIAAQDAGYKPGFLEPSPAELLKKMDVKEQADAEKAAKDAQAKADAAARAKEAAAMKPAPPLPICSACEAPSTMGAARAANAGAPVWLMVAPAAGTSAHCHHRRSPPINSARVCTVGVA